MGKIFEVKYGTMYNQNGIGIDNLAIIFDVNSGVLKYGDVSRGMKALYEDMINKYKKAGLDDMANDLMYLEFDRYDGVLSIEEICTFANYMILVSANSKTIMNMLNMSEEDLKIKIKALQELGF